MGAEVVAVFFTRQKYDFNGYGLLVVEASFLTVIVQSSKYNVQAQKKCIFAV